MAEANSGFSKTPAELRGVGDHQPEKSNRPVFGDVPQKRVKPKKPSTPRRQPDIQAGPHERPEFGVVHQKPPRTSALTKTLERTIQPAGLAEPATAKPKEKRPPMKIGDPFTVGPHLLRFNGVLGDSDTQVVGSFDRQEQMRIANIHRTANGLTIELAHEGSDASVSHVFIGKIGEDWQIVVPERVDPSE